MSDGVFMIKARKCRLCGRILTSKKAVEDGYGETCKCRALKIEKEEEPIDGQMNVFDYLDFSEE